MACTWSPRSMSRPASTRTERWCSASSPARPSSSTRRTWSTRSTSKRWGPPCGGRSAPTPGSARAATSCPRSPLPRRRLPRRRRTLLARRWRGAEHDRAADQADVAVGLRMVAEAARGVRVVLLGQQTGRAGAVEHLIEQLLGLGTPAGAQVRLDEPRRADVEAALEARDPVVEQVPVDRTAVAQVGLDLEYGRQEPRVVVGQQASQADPQCGRVEVVLAVGDGVCPDRLVPAPREHLLGDRVPQPHPVEPLRPAEAPPHLKTTVHGEPAHHLGVHVLAGWQPRLPDAVSGSCQRRSTAETIASMSSMSSSVGARWPASSAIRSATGPNTSSWTCRLAALPTRTGRTPA